jgi:hypothetical protein
VPFARSGRHERAIFETGNVLQSAAAEPAIASKKEEYRSSDSVQQRRFPSGFGEMITALPEG